MERLVLVGDFNIAHKDLDVARPQENKENTAVYLPGKRKVGWT